MAFDAIKFCEDYNIPYAKNGKNVSNGWVELHCPYRFCSDPSFHLGVNLKTGAHHCWICGNKGGPAKLAMHLLHMRYEQAEKIIIPYLSETEIEETQHQNCIDFPKNSKEILPQNYRDYLIKRNFDPDEIKIKYGVRAGNISGFFANRLIIPITKNKNLVNMVGRTIFNTSPRYKSLPNEKAVIPLNSCIYNLDSVEDQAIIVEGVFDVWRLGRCSVSIFGKVISANQVIELAKKKLKRAFVMLDKNEIKNASQIASTLSHFIPEVEVINLTHVDDPADMSPSDALSLKIELNLI